MWHCRQLIYLYPRCRWHDYTLIMWQNSPIWLWRRTGPPTLRALPRRIRWFTWRREKTRHLPYRRIDQRKLLACRVGCMGFNCLFHSCWYGRWSIGRNNNRWNEPGPVFLPNEIIMNSNVIRLKTSQEIIRIRNNFSIFSAEMICPFPTKSVDKLMWRWYSETCQQCPEGRC